MPPTDYEFKTQPFGPFQLEEFLENRDKIARGLLWEMGTGKSWETIAQAGWLIEQGKADCLLVVAPEGVHRNWITDELPKHMPDRILNRMRIFAYQSEKAATRWHAEQCAEVFRHPGPICVAMTYDAAITEPQRKRDPVSGRRTTTWKGGKQFLWDLLSERRCIYVADEARRIKNPKAKRTKIIVKSAEFAPYRRLLNGTPVPNGPMDIYSQMQFLDPKFWLAHGIGSFAEFKVMFAEYQKAFVRGEGGKLREFDQLIGYKNLDLLQTILKTICSRVTKDEVLDLPPKLYSRLTFDLTAAQERVYRELERDFMAYLDSGELITAPLAITRLLRFQQITSNFMPVASDKEEPIHRIGETNPLLDTVAEWAEDMPHSAIIWAAYNQTVDDLMAMLKTLDKTAVQYDGRVSGDQRERNKQAFQGGHAQFFVAKASTAGEGLTLHKARSVGYAENTFDLATRLQSEDRAHRIGQEHPVNYTDFVARGTVVEKIIGSLVDKFDIANQITGDKAREWLTN